MADIEMSDHISELPFSSALQRLLINDFFKKHKECRNLSRESLHFYVRLNLIHAEKHSVRCVALRRMGGNKPDRRCAGLLHSEALVRKLHQLWGLLKDLNASDDLVRDEIAGILSAFHCATHDHPEYYPPFAEKCLAIATETRTVYRLLAIPELEAKMEGLRMMEQRTLEQYDVLGVHHAVEVTEQILLAARVPEVPAEVISAVNKVRHGDGGQAWSQADQWALVALFRQACQSAEMAIQYRQMQLQ